MTGGTLLFAPCVTAEQRTAAVEAWESFKPDPDAQLVAYMNPRPSLWRQYVRGPLREAFWMSVGALSVLTLAVAGLVLGEFVPPMIFHWGER